MSCRGTLLDEVRVLLVYLLDGVGYHASGVFPALFILGSLAWADPRLRKASW